ncbi:hypothetical protein ABT084_21135 [Streptomyces sp. NPDC002138]|uniref:hypothetical protein n=1 Tax=Streptomyces sp. NPDC002138 TaxID=3154410 RepID=UPI0033307865
MTHRSLRQRLVIHATCVALATAGALLPAHAWAAGPVMPRLPMARALPAADWVEVTDNPSGITFKLPAPPKLTRTSKPTCRTYTAASAATSQTVAVCDIPGTDKMEYLYSTADGALDSFRKKAGSDVDSGTQETEVDGRPALDLHASGKNDPPHRLLFTARYIADDPYTVSALSFAYAKNEKALDQEHQQLLDSLRIPS